MHNPESLLLHTIPSFLKSLYARCFHTRIDYSQWVVDCKPIAQSEALRITWIGHASFLIQVMGINILTDPVFGNISLFFPRFTRPGMNHSQLPKIDYVLISHNHHDHMDAKSLFALKKSNPEMHVLVPALNKSWFDYYGFKQTSEFEWFEKHEHQEVIFTFLPANHWSQRGLFDKNATLWGSWMISNNNEHIYFAGDTAYSAHFSEIAESFPNISYALLPIGPGEPHEWMRNSHINHAQAIQAFCDLKAQTFIPMHWGTFPFGNDRFDEPILKLQQEWQKNNLAVEKLKIMKIGERI